MIKAIETRYAGCRFRSRLEARWAVFFDHLGIRWEYEPQGYVIGPYMADVTSNGFTPKERPYLPDFWLPDLRFWVEVKGADTALDLELMVNAAIPHWGLPESEGILVLGPLPPHNAAAVHAFLAFYKGDVFRRYGFFAPEGAFSASQHDHGWLGCDSGDIAKDVTLVAPCYTTDRRLPDKVNRAYDAARSARFEHGEQGTR